jgi:outer membrane protein OmpA-like peptidoglycan-associated protein
VLHNKKSCFSILMMLVASGMLLWSLAMPSSAQAFWWQDWFTEKPLWWQQEIPAPGPCQTINPDYVKKRYELAQAWNQLHRQNNLTRQSSRWTRRTYPKQKSDSRSLKKLRRFEQELKKTPMHLAAVTQECEAAQAATAGSAATGAGAAAATGAGAAAATGAGVAQAPAPKAKLIINSILFDLNSSAVRPEETIMLQEAANELKQNPDNAVVIEGHTCSLGSDQYNLWLSEKRAASAREVLVKKGLDAERLTTKGVGEAEPIADNTTPEGRAQNRRVEFKIME